MTTFTTNDLPRSIWLELALLMAGLTLLMVGVGHGPSQLLLISGMCFMLLGSVAGFEQRRALTRVPDSIRTRTATRWRIRLWQMRAWCWVAIGVAITLWGATP